MEIFIIIMPDLDRNRIDDIGQPIFDLLDVGWVFFLQKQKCIS